MLQIQLSFYVYYSGTEVNGKSARIRKELGLQDLVLMCKLNHFLPSAMDQKCGLSEQRLKERGETFRVNRQQTCFQWQRKELCPPFKLPACDCEVIYPYKILNDSSWKLMRMAEMNHKVLEIVNNLQETAGAQRVLCKDLC